MVEKKEITVAEYLEKNKDIIHNLSLCDCIGWRVEEAIEIYLKFKNMPGKKMERYIDLGIQYKLSEKQIMKIIYKLKRKIFIAL